MHIIIRFVVSALVLMLVGYITPGFSSMGFVNALVAAAVIAGLSFAAEMLLGREVSPYGRGGVGFVVSAIVIYFAQYLVPDMQVSIVGALLGALIIGLIDAFVPTLLR